MYCIRLLTDQEMAAFRDGPFQDMSPGKSFILFISLPAHLKQFNRVRRLNKSQNDLLVSKSKELQAIACKRCS